MSDFNPQDSLLLIRSMIDKTKEDLGENRFPFLLWGWLAFTAVLTQFALKVWLHYERHYFVWLVTLPAVVITIIYSARRQQRTGVRTYVGESMGHLWTGVGISFFVLVVILGRIGGWENAWPFFILFYGLGTFVSGRILKFTPLTIGGIVNWALALLAAFVPYDYQMLVAAAALLTSYIIPGHLLGAHKK